MVVSSRLSHRGLTARGLSSQTAEWQFLQTVTPWFSLVAHSLSSQITGWRSLSHQIIRISFDHYFTTDYFSLLVIGLFNFTFLTINQDQSGGWWVVVVG